jgi:hypothetical protein
VPAGPITGSIGSPGRSALAAYRRRRATELAAWTRSLAWRAPLVAAAGLASQVLAAQAGLPRAGLAGLAVAALVGWRLRFRPSEQARSWQRRAHGERHTARQLRRLDRDGFGCSTTWPSRVAGPILVGGGYLTRTECLGEGDGRGLDGPFLG